MKAVVLALVTAGCVATAAPRFPDDVAAALAQHDMRRLDTDELIVYYPADRADEAMRTTRAITTCLRAARTHAPSKRARPRLVMPELPYNNAFVMPIVNGYEDVAVVPTENTLDFTTEFGLPPDPGHIGCHEITHYVHAQQVGGFWRGVDWLFGDVITPQSGLDPWFWEGLATYQEQQGGAGRLRWPVWNQMFLAAYAGRGLDGDDLSEAKRLATPGHHYLVGSHFIEWLIASYGEERLWQVIAAQGSSVAFLLDLNGRFDRAYGKNLSTLIGEFSRALAAMPVRGVPDGERRIRAVGTDARYARARDGTEAWVAEDVDVPTHLEVRRADGTLVVSKNLVDVIVPRSLVMASPELVSGMSFSDDGAFLYLTVVDLAATYQTTRLLRVEIASGEMTVVASDLGPGGTITSDGRALAIEVDGDAWGLATIDLGTRERRVVIAPVPGHYVLKVATHGDRAAVSEWDGARFDVATYTINTSGAWTRERVIAGERAHPAYDASFTDDGRVLYLGEVDRRFQVFVDGVAISDAPFTAFEPRAAGNTVRFLDRAGWRWYLAEVALPPPVATSPSASITGTQVGLAPADVTTRGDRAYSPLDGLFTPQLHALGLAVPDTGVTMFGLALAGGDHLGLQRWAVTGLVNLRPKPALFGWSAQYALSALAPWTFVAAAQDLRWHHGIDTDPNTPGFEAHADRDALDLGASFGRVIRGTTAVSANAVYTRDHYSDLTPAHVQLGGFGLAFAHDSSESTLYGGTRRRVALGLDGTYYPYTSLGTRLIDTRAELDLTAPIPSTRRHALSLSLIDRTITELNDVSAVPLVVGGTGAYAPLWQHRDTLADPPAFAITGFPERLRFTEPLRGFEDWELPARAAALGSLTWTYPIIIDAGWATSLRYFPAILLRQIDLELFGAGALVRPPDNGAMTRHLDAGGAITASIYFWRLPLLVQYQAARRFTDDDAITQQVGIGFGF